VIILSCIITYSSASSSFVPVQVYFPDEKKNLALIYDKYPQIRVVNYPNSKHELVFTKMTVE